MIHGFREVTIGSVVIAPFILYGTAALCVLFALRPVLRGLAADRFFANAPVAGLSLYVIILAVLIVFI
jgi:hypothetical protein